MSYFENDLSKYYVSQGVNYKNLYIICSVPCTFTVDIIKSEIHFLLERT